MWNFMDFNNGDVDMHLRRVVGELLLEPVRIFCISNHGGRAIAFSPWTVAERQVRVQPTRRYVAERAAAGRPVEGAFALASKENR